MYDYLLVGSGLTNAVFAREAVRRGKKCLVIEKRPHVGGNLYTRRMHGIDVHMYGPHIFHTSSSTVWEYMNELVPFVPYVHTPVTVAHGRTYNLPFNMNTFSRIWPVTAPDEAWERIDRERGEIRTEPRNLEEKAISLVGRELYELLIKGYTEKQWGRDAKDLPPEIITRIPVRFTYDNNYFTEPYQGIPRDGYTELINKMLEGCDIRLQTDFLEDKEGFRKLAKRTVYSGQPDAYFNWCEGELTYRSLRFTHTYLPDTDNLQGISVMNFADRDIPYTRRVEHKHFIPREQQDGTVVTYEYPCAWEHGREAYYPVNDARNNELYARYREMAQAEKNVLFCGRLGLYRYMDMQDAVRSALDLARSEL